MKHLFTYNLLIVMCLAFSCQVETTDRQQMTFFDLNDFFKKENTRISYVKKIKKKVKVNEKLEEKILDNFDFKKDLEVFINSNINKIALLDKYEVDSTFEKKVLNKIQYKAKDKNLKTRELVVNFKNNSVESIFIHNISSNAVASSEQNLLYQTNIGYSMNSKQRVSLSDEQIRSVEVEFIFENNINFSR